MFGLSEEQIADIGMTWGLGGLIALMLFIIGDLALKSKAGRLGTFVLFLVLAFGILGFLIKSLLTWMMNL